MSACASCKVATNPPIRGRSLYSDFDPVAGGKISETYQTICQNCGFEFQTTFVVSYATVRPTIPVASLPVAAAPVPLLPPIVPSPVPVKL